MLAAVLSSIAVTKQPSLATQFGLFDNPAFEGEKGGGKCQKLYMGIGDMVLVMRLVTGGFPAACLFFGFNSLVYIL